VVVDPGESVLDGEVHRPVGVGRPAGTQRQRGAGAEVEEPAAVERDGQEVAGVVVLEDDGGGGVGLGHRQDDAGAAVVALRDDVALAEDEGAFGSSRAAIAPPRVA
jgi:hypothetical protein